MDLGLFFANWWLLLPAAAAAGVLAFVLVAGHGAEGGMTGRTRMGWHKWRALSKKAGDVQARVLLTAFYFTFAAPFGLLRSHLGDPLQLNVPPPNRSWHARRTRDLTVDDARRQF
jgi:hypothetical protein